jgi:hypothetical protein
MKIVEYLKRLVLGAWKPTFTGFVYAILGICVAVVAKSGAVLQQAMFDESSIPDPTARITAVVTRDGIFIALGVLCLVLLIGAIALAMAKYRTAIAFQRKLRHGYDNRKDG